MGYDRLDLAEALLAKARSTAFEPERATFVAGAHDQLAAFLRSRPAGGPAGDDHGPAGRHRPAPARHAAVPARPAPVPLRQVAVPARQAPVRALPAATGRPEEAPILDLTAVELAYRSRYRPQPGAGALVDLAI